MTPHVRALGATAALLGVASLLTPVDLLAQTRYTRGQEREFYEATSRAIAHGDRDGAATMAVERDETDPSAVAVRGRLLMDRGALEEARALLSPVAEAHPYSAAGLELGRLLLRTGEAGPAASYLNAVIDDGAASRRPLPLFRAALAAQALGRFQDANTLFRAAASGAPEDPAVHTAWGELFLEKYNQADALESFTEALTLDDEWAPAHLGLARALANQNPPQARASAEQALQIDSGLAAAHLFLAEQELGDQDYEAARASVDRALAIDDAEPRGPGHGGGDGLPGGSNRRLRP